MPRLLICTVGGSPEPIAATLKHWQPSRTLFVPSRETREQVAAKILPLAAAEPNGFVLTDGAYDCLELPNAQDFAGCVRLMRELTGEVNRWLARGADFDVVVDFTGGTKCMSAALALQSHPWGCRFSYVGGSERTKEDVGIVVSGKEQVLHAQNPWAALGYQAVEDAITLFNHTAFGAASTLLHNALYKVQDSVRKRELSAFKTLADAYDSWDHFEHKTASRLLKDVPRAENDLRALFDRRQAEHLRDRVEQHCSYLAELLGKPGRTSPRVADLLANAQRRGSERRFDDAVARLYRAIEALAQTRLREVHGIDHTAKVALERLPEKLRREKAAAGKDNGTVFLGLQDDYAFLLETGDALGEAFQSRRLADREKSNLQARNASVLAHGFDPVSEEVYKNLLADAMVLAETAGIRSTDWPVFPQLTKTG